VDGFAVQGPGNTSGYSVKYLAGATGSTTITSSVVNGSYVVRNVAAGKSKTLRLVETVKAGTAVGASNNWLMFAMSRRDVAPRCRAAMSRRDGTRKDAVNASVKVVA
jgi:hypothetical protein